VVDDAAAFLPAASCAASAAPRGSQRRLVGRTAPAVPEASEASTAVVAAPQAAQLHSGVEMRLDVTVWRSRPWWWRLAASLVIRRLGR
jgi:hypothetical protein